MTTYSKETALYNTGAIGDDIQEAGEKADKYLTNISDDGVFVHKYDAGSPDGSGASDNGVKITNQVDIIRDGESVASYGEGVRIGKLKSGHTSIIMDPESQLSDISKILQIKTSNDVFAQNIILDSTYTSSISIWKSYYDGNNPIYEMDGIGSYEDPLTTSTRSTSESFILSDVDNIPNGTTFYIGTIYNVRRKSDIVTGFSHHEFIKSTAGSSSTSVVNDTFKGSDYPGFISGAQINVTISITYNPPNSFDIELSSNLSATPSNNYKYWIPDLDIQHLVYTLSDVKIPIHQLYGDVYVCNALNLSDTYSPKGNFYIGIDSNDDVIYQLTQYYSISPIPVIKNSSLDVKKFFTDVAKTMVDTKNIKSKLKFYIETITPSGYNFTANQYRSLTSSNVPTHSGFTPLIVEARCTNKSALHVFNYTLINNGGTLSYEVINRTSSAVNDANFSFKILYIRNDFIG